MAKMLESDVRHLPLLDEKDHVVGMLSIKDCAKAVVQDYDKSIQMLEDLASGKGGTFVVD
jgi:CBS domain-containing protein